MEIGHSDLYAQYADDKQSAKLVLETENGECEDIGEVEDFKYVNSQDYLDIGQTVFTQWDGAAPEVAPTPGFIKEEQIDPDDAQMLAISGKIRQLFNKEIEPETRNVIKAEVQINAGPSIISRAEDRITASDIKEPCRSTELEILKEQVTSWRVVLHRLPADSLLASNTTSDEDKHTIFKVGDVEKKTNVTSRVVNFKNQLRRDKSERPFKCRICSHQSIRKEHLKSHMSTHTGKKPYKCEICNSSFVRVSELQRHVRIHTGDKPYKCDLCDCRFTQPSHLKNHMFIHSGDKPFKCEICDYQSIRKADLQRHMRLHSGSNTYNCDLCDRRCVQKISLQDHMMKCHLGIKPYKCDLCNYRCIRKFHLASHFRTHIVKKGN